MLNTQITPPIYQIQGMLPSGSYPVSITMSMPPWDDPEGEAAIISGIAAMVSAVPGIVMTTTQQWGEQAGPPVEWHAPNQA